ncbi:MAG: Ldh family oxidoreductase [Streptosporangiales bacterium]|nr:Ldh family oxidoreductase [Streptosporangiales bacterium]
MPTDNLPTKQDLEDHAAALLCAAEMPAAHAARTASCLVAADLWGIASHGLFRLPFYLRRIRSYGLDPRAELRAVGDTGPLVTLDGGAGLGHWQMWWAAETARDRARRYGVAAVALGNSGHCGALGLYVLPLVDAGLAGLVFSHGPAVMPPWDGTSAVLSTSPLAVGAPLGDGGSGHGDPLIVDLATSAVARGTIGHRAQAGIPLEPGWAFDADGRPTTDAREALHGMMAPLGGAKGYALALAVEALTAALVGPSLSRDLADMFDSADEARPQRVAHVIIALDADRCSVDGEGTTRRSALAEAVREAGGRLPGERRVPPDRMPPDSPVPVSADTLVELDRWADEFGIPRLDASAVR